MQATLRATDGNGWRLYAAGGYMLSGCDILITAVVR